MNSLTTPQHVNIVRFFYTNNNYVRTVYRLLREDYYGSFNHLNERTICNVVKKEYVQKRICDM